MLIWVNENREIIRYNKYISKEDAQNYINENCIWFDNLDINIPFQEGKETVMFLNTDNTIQYEFVNKISASQPYQPTNAEIAQLISDLQADILIAQGGVK